MRRRRLCRPAEAKSSVTAGQCQGETHRCDEAGRGLTPEPLELPSGGSRRRTARPSQRPRPLITSELNQRSFTERKCESPRSLGSRAPGVEAGARVYARPLGRPSACCRALPRTFPRTREWGWTPTDFWEWAEAARNTWIRRYPNRRYWAKEAMWKSWFFRCLDRRSDTMTSATLPYSARCGNSRRGAGSR